jgi:hypothetical protein
VKVELIIPELVNRQGRLDRHWSYDRAATSVTFAVDGVLARREPGLQLTKPESSWNWDKTKQLGLRGCLLTIDFERDTAPILPSRNDLDLVPDFDAIVRGVLEQELPSLLARLGELPSVAAEHGLRRNRAIVSALVCLGVTDENRGGVVGTEAVESAVAELYRGGLSSSLDFCGVRDMGAPR